MQTENSSVESGGGNALLLPGRWWSRSVVFALPFLAVLIQIQATFAWGGTDVRVNLADLALGVSSPLLVAVGICKIRDLYRASGLAFLVAIGLASAVMTASLLIGREAMGGFTGWALIKYAGWYVLLAYLGAGMLLGLTGGVQHLWRFVSAFLAFQVLVVLVFFCTIILSVNTPLNFGPRLTGLAENPNAMGLYLLCGVSLSISYLGRADLGERTGRLLFAAAVILIAGVLFTRSIAALIGLTILLAAALVLRIATPKRTIVLLAVVGVVWSTPQITETTSGIEVNVFSKLFLLIPENAQSYDQPLSNFRGTTLTARLDSYRSAFSEWQTAPAFGAGLGTHLDAQERSGPPGAPLVQIHSTYLWLLTETGLAGLAGMATLFILVFAPVSRTAKGYHGPGHDDALFAMAMILVLISWAVLSLFHELMYQRVVWLLAGMALAISVRGAPNAMGRVHLSDDRVVADLSGGNGIFYVIGSLQTGGAETHLARVAPRLVERGYSVTVYNFSGLGKLGEIMSKSGVKVLGPPLNASPGHIRPIRALLLALSAVKLFGIFLFRRPRLVHFFLPQTYIISAILARAAGLRRLIMSRRSLNNYQEKHPFLGRLERRLHAGMTVILGNSQRVLDQLREEEDVPPEKLGLIYNGIDCSQYDTPTDRRAKRGELGIGLSAKVAIIVANLIPYKGHTDLLRGLARARDALPCGWKLLAVGRDDGIGRELRTLTAKLGLEDNMSFLGERDDVPELLGICDVGVLCSHEEGFSNAILEGMAAGLPMVVTDVGGNAEAVADGISGIVVPPRSPDDLGQAIRQLMNDPAMRRRMGQAGRKRVRKHFSLQACVDKYQKLYDELDSGYVPEGLSGKITTD